MMKFFVYSLVFIVFTNGLLGSSVGYQMLIDSKYEQAIIEYENALNHNQDDPYLHFNIGIAYYRTLRYSSAQRSFENAVRLNIEDPVFQAQAEYNIGNALFQQAKLFHVNEPDRSVLYLKEAIQAYEHALDLGDDFVLAEENLKVGRQVLQSLEANEVPPVFEEETSEQQSAQNDAPDADKSESQEGSSKSNASDGLGSPVPGASDVESLREENLGSGSMGRNMSLQEAIMLLDSVELDEKRISLSTLQKSDKENLSSNSLLNW